MQQVTSKEEEAVALQKEVRRLQEILKQREDMMEKNKHSITQLQRETDSLYRQVNTHTKYKHTKNHKLASLGIDTWERSGVSMSLVVVWSARVCLAEGCLWGLRWAHSCVIFPVCCIDNPHIGMEFQLTPFN